MKPLDHQVELSEQTFEVLKTNGLAYLAAEERTGKTITSLLVAEKSKLTSVLIITKKKALPDWQKVLKIDWLTKNYTATNYHNLSKLKENYQLIIIDEAHEYLGGCPKKGHILKTLIPFCNGKHILYLSATPHAQGYHTLYHQFYLSSKSPWREYSNYYKWYKKYAIRDGNGNTEKIRIKGGRLVETYKKVDEQRIKSEIDHLFIRKTRKELGFKKEPLDKIHYLELNENTKEAYNLLIKHKVLDFKLNGENYFIEADSSMKLRTSLHMLEGGTLKIDKPLVLNNQEKIDYIKEKWGDSDDVVIMYHYISEGIKLKDHFKKATILQGISYAEGIDLSHKKHLIIYSQNFSTSKHTQRRARQANFKREDDIVVHYLLVKNAISDQVYKTVSINKVNYVDASFKRGAI